jgi:hypothetical protein
LNALNDAYPIGRQTTLFAKAQYINSGKVPMEDRKTAKGVGADPSPPPIIGWSVGTVKPSKDASTRDPPEKLMIISMLENSLFLDDCLNR